MQEHKYIYEHGLAQIQQYGAERTSIQDDDLNRCEAVQRETPVGQEAGSENASRAEELEELRDQRATLRMGRGLTLALVVSFLASLAALWFSGALISAPDQVLPITFLQMLAANRVPVLCVPAVFLVICYFALRSLTREIMVGPENRLDERQKILRAQAQRSAFKMLKFASVLVPVGFVLPHLPWFNAGAPGMAFFDVISVRDSPAWYYASSVRQLGLAWFRGPYLAPLLQPASGLEIALAGGLLLVCLLVMFSALPMAALAWKGEA
ncbi:MAG TPA: hypothetical protein VF458_07050 [Ktedonobacteraceae bacterium]